MQSYENFELLVGARGTAGYSLTVIQSPVGEANAFCSLDSHDAEFQNALRTIEEGNTDEPFLAELGDYLFSELFPDTIVGLYRSSLNMVRSQQKRLRVRLRIEPPELAALPWEYLHDAQEDMFLAISAETALVRYIPMRVPVRPISMTFPLRILVVIATPADLPSLNVTQEKQLIEAALVEWRQQGKVELHVIEVATVANINQVMRSFQPHVFHFVGHGRFDDDHAVVMLLDDKGKAHPINESTFREFFANCQSTRLAVLNACQTATLSSTQPLTGLAPNLLQRQLSAVVAMQYPVPDQTALIFVREFYRCLVLGYGVDAAISEARKGIFMELGAGSPEWGAPVLFLRAKDGHFFQMEETTTARRLDIPLPPEPVDPPEITTFVGRETELSYYAEQMQQTQLALIVGMPGVGKSSLAAVLVRQVGIPGKTFWHSFQPNEGLDILIWKLAGFLAWCQYPALWEMLQGVLQSGGQLPPLNLLLDYLCQMLRGKHYLLCLDDFQYVDRDPLLETFVERVAPLRRSGELTLLITSHRIPAFARDSGIQPLDGMSRIDTVRLLTARQLKLRDDLIEQLYRYTEGNAAFLTIAINALARANEPAHLITRLTQSDNIEHYLLNELDATLTEEERNIEATVAVLGEPSTRNVIEITLDTENLRRPLSSLSERYLLTTQQEAQERTYGQHAILQAFYYDQPSRRQRQELHRRAAGYYIDEEKSILKAAYHYWQAGDITVAVQLGTQDVATLLNHGQGRPLLQLLLQFTEQAVTVEQWIEVLLARGRVYTLVGEQMPAQASFEQAYAFLQQLPETQVTNERRARACQGMGELLQYRLPQEALIWLERGLANLHASNLLTVLPGQKPLAVASLLHIQVGSVQIALGNYSTAVSTLEQLLTQLPTTINVLRADALLTLGTAYGYQGEAIREQQCMQAALEISTQLRDRFQMLKLLHNLGISKEIAGEWNGALADYQQAIKLAEEVGDVGEQAAIRNSLGILLGKQGYSEAALGELTVALALARKHDLAESLLCVLTSLADLACRLEQWPTIEPLLQEAEQLAEQTGIQYPQPAIHYTWAQLHLAQDNGDAALDAAMRALQIAQSLVMPIEVGIAWRVLGQVHQAQGQYTAAQNAYAESVSQLTNQDPYELARSQALWAALLQTNGQQSRSEELLQQSQTTFSRLCVQSGLTRVVTE